MNLFSGLKGEGLKWGRLVQEYLEIGKVSPEEWAKQYLCEPQPMSLHIHILYTEGGEWQSLQVSGSILQEIRQTGTWNNQKLHALKYPDGRVWYFSTRAWKK